MPGSVLTEATEEVFNLLGDRDYVPCRGLADTSSVALHRLVIRKERRLFPALLKGPVSYKVQASNLSDILTSTTQSASGDLQPDGEWSESFQVTHKDLGDFKFAAAAVTSGSAQARVPGDALDIGVQVDQSVSSGTQVSLRLERLEGMALENLLKELQETWHFRQNHRLWELVKKQRKSIRVCFVTDVIKTDKCMTVHSKHGLGGSARAFIDKLAELTMRHSQTRNRELRLPENAVLLYKVQELNINAQDGRIVAPLGTMAQSGDAKCGNEAINPDKEIEKCQKFFKEFFGQLNPDKQVQLRNAIMLKLLSKHNHEGSSSSNCSQESGDCGNVQLCCDHASEIDGQLKALRVKVKAALPTDTEPRIAEIEKLMETLGLPPTFLDLPAENSAIYGIRYFVAALSRLPTEAWQSLVRCSAAKLGPRVVAEVEQFITCTADGETYNPPQEDEIVQFLQDAIVSCSSSDSFVCAWRAAYMAAIHMFGCA